jgi:UDP-3-O-[3-hydroxymyristoyl] N-acetylglucosamine deacetylase
MIKTAFHASSQHTVADVIHCEGVGLHTGAPVYMAIYPAAENHGIQFIRSDVTRAKPIPARADLVTETQLGTTLQRDGANKISTVEHLMAALWGLGVDNARIVVDGPEVPIMDGSSAPFIALIEATGLREQAEERQFLEITEKVTLQQGDSELTLLPHDGFCVEIEIDYDHPQIARQLARYDFSHCNFDETLSAARTFGFAREVEQLRAMGLARGGSLENAVVLGDDGILNPEGLRFDDEFVRHKALDCVGDLYLTGRYIRGKVIARKPGHTINTAMARELLTTPATALTLSGELAEHHASTVAVYASL